MPTEKSIYGIIGFPVAHSLSPQMHNAAFKELKVKAEYKRIPLKEEELRGFFEGLKDAESPIFGLNVTVPYKEKVVEYMDTLSPFAKRVMAVNTIVISSDRKLEGFNTDGPGFLTHLIELGIDVSGKAIAILGSGGTTRAILSVLCLLPNRPKSIVIYNRHPQKTEILLKNLALRMDMSICKSVAAIEDLGLRSTDLLINTTPVGLKVDDHSLVPEVFLHKNLFVYDVIYNPEETMLLKNAKNKGAKTSNGLGMLFYQGVLSFQHWAGVELPPKIKNKMRASLTEGNGR